MMMNVVMLSPGFPAEMPWFALGLAEVGAHVIGIGEQPEAMLPEATRRALDVYVQVGSLWDEAAMTEQLRMIGRRVRIDRIECLWEPGVMLAASLRERFELPGMSVEQATLFRDKEAMKRRLDDAGIRTPRHAVATDGGEIRAAAEQIGFPLIVKPVAGAGSADTHRVDDAKALERVIPRVRHVAQLSVEEYVEGEEFTFDTICAGGDVLYHNVAWYRPKPLLARTIEWSSPQTVSLRDPDRADLAPGVRMGHEVLRALGFDTGFTHMEWFLTPDGEAVFGEIAARPPGARSVDLMNYACDFDSFTGWAEAVCHGRMSAPWSRRYNAAVIFKRAKGSGRIARIEGLERLVARYRRNIVCVDLLPVGAPRRDWKMSLISDGFLIVRHPDFTATLDMADRIGTDLRLFAS
ncbi:MAG: ATP-grasp domain-containing protein [bacterium]|nr:ATP-grasp domain-containing protein [bacterium]